ncbi:MAG: sigma factor-like helix-turn-helix DNA-binding protein [Lachnospiraceae bacterium]|nr:sigma factor-like helix-turn-helix DNA-binding protein [Lachnospiraceae bacterium]
MKNYGYTFAQLKELVESTQGKSLPTKKQLLESGVEVVAATSSLVVFRNGFFLYTNGGYSTVYRVDSCNRLAFPMVNQQETGPAEKLVYVYEESYLQEPWSMVLEIAGEHRLEHNAEVRAMDHSQISLIDAAAEINAIDLVGDCGVHKQSRMQLYNLEDELIEAAERERKLALLTKAKQVLSESERRVIDLYYDVEPRTESQVGQALGISQQAVHKARIKAQEKMKAYFEKCGC